MPPLNTHQRREHLTSNDKRNSPITPAVTGIDYPFDDASTTDVDSRPRGHQSHFYTMNNVAASNIGDVVDPPASTPGLDEVWNSIRQDKSRKMAKEKPKVQSLEEVTQELLYIDQGAIPNAPAIEPQNGSAPKSPRRQRSMYGSLFLGRLRDGQKR